MIESPDLVTDVVWSAADSSGVVGETEIFRFFKFYIRCFSIHFQSNTMRK